MITQSPVLEWLVNSETLLVRTHHTSSINGPAIQDANEIRIAEMLEDQTYNIYPVSILEHPYTLLISLIGMAHVFGNGSMQNRMVNTIGGLRPAEEVILEYVYAYSKRFNVSVSDANFAYDHLEKESVDLNYDSNGWYMKDQEKDVSYGGIFLEGWEDLDRANWLALFHGTLSDNLKGMLPASCKTIKAILIDLLRSTAIKYQNSFLQKEMDCSFLRFMFA